MKQTEGNPATKGRIRRLQRAGAPPAHAARTSSRATVVVTNPTHFAVALEYSHRDGLPRPSWPRARTCWRSRSRRSRAGMAFPSSRIRRWRRACTAPSRSARRFPQSSTRPWPKFLPSSIAHAAPQQTWPGRNVLMAGSQPEAASLSQERKLRLDRSGRRRLGMVFVMLVPVPSFLLDLLLAISITASVHRPALGGCTSCARCSFRSSPACCFCSRSSVCRSTSPARRRILLHGNEGTAAAGQRDRRLRAVRRRRQLRGRLRAVHRPDRHSVPGGQPWRGAHRRGHGALHPRRYSGQADGYRRRPQRWTDRRISRPARAAKPSPAKPSSTAPWTAPPASTSATRSPLF